MKYSDIKKTTGQKIIGIKNYDDYKKYDFLAMHISEAKLYLMDDSLSDTKK